MDDYYAEESDYDDSFDISDFVEDWNFRHSLEHALVGGPVWQPVGDPIVIPGYTLDDQGVWQPPDDPSVRLCNLTHVNRPSGGLLPKQ